MFGVRGKAVVQCLNSSSLSLKMTDVVNAERWRRGSEAVQQIQQRGYEVTAKGENYSQTVSLAARLRSRRILVVTNVDAVSDSTNFRVGRWRKILHYTEGRHQVSWVSDWVRDFSPWASWAMEAMKETVFGTKVASGMRMMSELRIRARIAQRKRAIPHSTKKNNRNIIECCDNTHVPENKSVLALRTSVTLVTLLI